MLLPRTVVNAWIAGASLALLYLPAFFACSSTEVGAGGAGSSAGGSANSQSGSPATGGLTGGAVNGTAGSAQSAAGSGPGTSGASATGGSPSGGVTSGGAAGAAGTTTGGTPGGGMGGADPGDTPPVRPLMVTAAIGEHLHGKAGLDTRAKKMLGKLVVDLGVNEGGYSSFLAKRGYHSMGAPCGACPAPDLKAGGRDGVGDCRLNTEFANTQASVKSQLVALQAKYPEEDWGYFLNQDGSVRWSDVAVTGISHGATAAAVAGRLGARMWRVVSRSGPRDNECGLTTNAGKCTAPISTPAYDTACPDAQVASWLDKPSKTPIERFYGIVGMNDGQCGDIMFNMHRTHYVGVPTIFDNAQADLTGTNQFFSAAGGHDDYLAAPSKSLRTDEVLEIAFAIPPENRKPAF